MKTLGIALAINLSSVAAVVCALLAAIHGVTGWGWFLLIAVLVSKTYQEND
jgi:hypothetical protein